MSNQRRSRNMKITLEQALEAQKIMQELTRRASMWVYNSFDPDDRPVLVIEPKKATLWEARTERDWGDSYYLEWDETDIDIEKLFWTDEERDEFKREAAAKREKEHLDFLVQMEELKRKAEYNSYLVLKAKFEPSSGSKE